ncbi:Protein of unknown function [Gryllus bimaculatus]|nr:Protein of unknown function [Gryllus bimaculatus]
MRWLACVSALLLASAVAEAQQCGGESGAVAGGVGAGATRLWLSGEHNATGHWTATLRLEKDSAVGQPGRQAACS